MARYDIESFLSDIESALKRRFNDRLVAISSEKGDGLPLKEVRSDAYTVQTLSERVLNCDPFIVIGVDEITTEAIGPSSSHTIRASVTLITVDDRGLPDPHKRMLRYLRALEEIFLKDWASVGGQNKIKVQSIAPVPVNLFDQSTEYLATGVLLEVALG